MDPAIRAFHRARKTRRRILVLTIPSLGWSSYAESLRTALSDEPDVDIAHVLLRAQLPQRALSRRYPGEAGLLDTGVRRRLLWRLRLPFVVRMLRSGRFDAVHAATEHAGLLMAAAKRVTGIPYSLAVDSTTVLNEEGPWRASGPRALSLVDDYDRRAFAEAAFIAPWSEWAAASLRGDYGVRSIIVTPPSLDVAATVTRPQLRAPGPLRIVFIGNDWQRKGGDRLVAWHQQHLRETELHIVSRGAPSLAGVHNVICHGAMPRERLRRDLLPRMDALAHPTTSDCSPFVVVEAAAAGVPAVASRLGGIPELVRDGVTGVLCDPGDDREFVNALTRFAARPEETVELGRAARAWARESFEAHARYRPIVDRLLETIGPLPDRP